MITARLAEVLFTEALQRYLRQLPEGRTGWLAGSGLGVGSFGFVYSAFDVYPQLAPPAAFTVPSTPIAVTAAISAAIVLLASIATHLLAERTRPAEILRLE